MEKNRIDYLDSLRGLASVSVVVSHFVLAYRLDLQFKLLNYSPLHFFYDGFAAVTFFFVLSGYVLTLSLKNRDQISLNSFYLKRIFRIMPAYIVVLLISLLLYYYYVHINTIPETSNWIDSFWNKPLDLKNFVKQLFFIIPNVDNAELVFQNWSLNVEMKFSFIIPFLIFIYKKSNFFFFFIFNLVLFLFFNLPIYLIHFSLGITLAMNQDIIVEKFTIIKKKYKVILILSILFMYTYRYTLPMYYYYIQRRHSLILNNENLIWLITGFGSFLILLYCFTSIRLQKVLNLIFFKFIGKISYAIYLTHIFVLIFFLPIFIKELNNMGIMNLNLINSISLFVLMLLTIVFSCFLTFMVEIPIAKFGNKLIKRRIVVKANN